MWKERVGCVRGRARGRKEDEKTGWGIGQVGVVSGEREISHLGQAYIYTKRLVAFLPTVGWFLHTRVGMS